MKLDTYIPRIEDLWFRRLILSDEQTMSYNHNYGGTIDFSEDKWNSWYSKWILNNENKRFYRYLTSDNEFVGEIAYYFDENTNRYLTHILIYSKYRELGYGKQALKLICLEAIKNNVDYLYDDIAIDNPAIKLFIDCGFIEEYRNNEIIMVKKKL